MAGIKKNTSKKKPAKSIEPSPEKKFIDAENYADDDDQFIEDADPDFPDIIDEQEVQPWQDDEDDEDF